MPFALVLGSVVLQYMGNERTPEGGGVHAGERRKARHDAEQTIKICLQIFAVSSILLARGISPKKMKSEVKRMKVKFDGLLLIGCRSYVNKSGVQVSGGVLYNPETSETLNFTADKVVKDTLKPVAGELDISVGHGKGGSEWVRVKLL